VGADHDSHGHEDGSTSLDAGRPRGGVRLAGDGTSSVRIEQHRYVLAVPDLSASAEWYRDVLGFTIREVGDPGWRLLVHGDCVIFAGQCPDAIPPRELGDHSYFAHWIVDDVDAVHARATAHAVEIVKPLRTEPWAMREFGLRTRDGHRIMIAQRTA
jgi:catechol 2,3-dioxygenase-like lactoylglutathione lyase family enzyme